ncbi:MAG: DNRLRE domain-containing protein, partial [Propionibacteriaceae bacterium]|nr:DNRLRE domain-containing protein [Propionibacteriaceae bacterium]
VTVAYTPGSNPIQDVAGNDAAGFAAVAVSNTTPPAGGSQTFTPFEDAQVKSTSANTNYGNDTTLRLREESGGTTYQSYIKFNVTGLTGPVTSVKLRLFVTDNSTNTTSVYTSSSTWAESTLTWTNRPTMGTTVLGSGIPSVTGAWVEIDLTASALAAGNGTYSFGLRNSGTTSAIFSSSEATAANRPQLVVTYGS